MRSVDVLSLAFAAGGAALVGTMCAMVGCGQAAAPVTNRTDDTPSFGAGPCIDLQCRRVACGGDVTTTITGTVVAPNGVDPVYNAIVYVPDAPLEPIVQGASCERCGKVSGMPISSGVSGADGRFVLTNVPAGDDIPIVVQVGKWRRLATLPHVDACAENRASTAFTHLPRSHVEGDIPLHAVATGGSDALECVLRKMGVDDAEFTIPSGGGRVHMYAGNGAVMDNIPPASSLTGDFATLKQYDVVLFDCEGQQHDKPADTKQRVVDYTAAGGRVLASHYSYVWLYDIAPFSGTAEWKVDQDVPSAVALTGIIDTSFPKGAAFARWMAYVGALSSAYERKLQIYEPRFDAIDVVAPAQRWIYSETPSTLQQYTFNAPLGLPEEQQCGRVAFSDFHVTALGTPMSSAGMVFPSECDSTTADMSPQERVLEFMLLDLASCIQNDRTPQPILR